LEAGFFCLDKCPDITLLDLERSLSVSSKRPREQPFTAANCRRRLSMKLGGGVSAMTARIAPDFNACSNAQSVSLRCGVMKIMFRVEKPAWSNPHG
jgi:hypothetical protein